jgi:hypothetical protein
MTTEQEQRRLDALLRDVLAVDEPDPALMARYAEDPNGLAPEVRRELEEQLAGSPALRDQLRMLQSFDLTALQQEAEPAESEPSSGRSIAERLGELLAALFTPPVLVTAALVLCLLPVGWYLTRPAAQPEAPLAAAPDPGPPPPPETSSPVDTAPRALPERLAAENIGAESADQVRDELIAELRMKDPPADEGPPVIAKPSAPRAPEPPKAPAGTAEPGADPAPRAQPDPPQPAKPVAPPPAREVVIAMNDLPALPSYASPSGASSEFAMMRTSGRSRSAGSRLPDVTVLVPEHPGQTSQASPDVYWYLAAATDRPMAVTLIDADEYETLLQVVLPGPHPAGIGRFSLARRGAVLPRGRVILAHVSVLAGAEPGKDDRVASGGIERVRPSANLKGELRAAGPAKAAHVYAKHGLWLDALAAASRQSSSHPGDAALREQRATLLDQVGLQPAAEWDRTH